MKKIILLAAIGAIVVAVRQLVALGYSVISPVEMLLANHIINLFTTFLMVAAWVAVALFMFSLRKNYDCCQRYFTRDMRKFALLAFIAVGLWTCVNLFNCGSLLASYISLKEFIDSTGWIWMGIIGGFLSFIGFSLMAPFFFTMIIKSKN